MTGYGALATLMARHQKIEVFRKFSSMSMENISRMQAELHHLEMVINQMRKVPELNSFDRVWVGCPDSMFDEDAHQLIERSRTLLEQYHRALLQTAQVNALNQPPKDYLELRRHWYDEESGGDQFLYGEEAGQFRDSNIETDLLMLNDTVGSRDALVSFLGRRILPVYHRLVGYKLHRSMSERGFERAWEYKPEALVRAGNTICMLLSAVIPALSILVLFSVQSMAARLVAISMMSLIFSLVMNVIAQRRADVFMSTTAFAAVLVVFVGSANVMDG